MTVNVVGTACIQDAVALGGANATVNVPAGNVPGSGQSGTATMLLAISAVTLNSLQGKPVRKSN